MQTTGARRTAARAGSPARSAPAAPAAHGFFRGLAFGLPAAVALWAGILWAAARLLP